MISRKIIAGLLALTLITPSVALAVDEQLPTSAGTGSGAAINNSTQGTLSNGTAAQIEALTENGQTVGCSSNGNFGGSLANALGASLQQAIPGLLRSQLGGLVGKLSAKAGPFAPLVNALGKIAIDKLSGLAQQKLGELFSSSLGGQLGSSLAGGAAGLASGIGAGAVGAAAGASVPVNVVGEVKENVAKMQTDTVQIRKDQLRDADANETLAYKECVSDPLVAKIKNALMAMLTRSMMDWVNNGFEGGPAFVQHLRTFLQEGTQALLQDFVNNQLSGICTPYQQDIQTIILTKYQYEQNFGAQVQCPTDTSTAGVSGSHTFSAEDAFNRFKEAARSPIATTLTVQSNFRVQRGEHAAATLVDHLNSEGFRSKCKTEEDAPPGTFTQNCEIVVPGSLIKDSVARKLGLADQQLLNADEIGEIIDALMQSLNQVAFEGIDGLLGLSKSSNDSGSYLDNLVAEATGESMGGAQDAVAGDILGAIEVEQAYSNILNDVITDLQMIKKTYTDMALCYKPLANTNNQVAVQAMQHASTTVTTVIDPQILSFTAEFNDSSDALDQLEILYTQAQSALTPADILEVNTALNQLVAAGIVHTRTDLNFLENDMTAGALALQTLFTDATEKLLQCKAL